MQLLIFMTASPLRFINSPLDWKSGRSMDQAPAARGKMTIKRAIYSYIITVNISMPKDIREVNLCPIASKP
jgi:hypothetical protein